MFAECTDGITRHTGRRCSASSSAFDNCPCPTQNRAARLWLGLKRGNARALGFDERGNPVENFADHVVVTVPDPRTLLRELVGLIR